MNDMHQIGGRFRGALLATAFVAMAMLIGCGSGSVPPDAPSGGQTGGGATSQPASTSSGAVAPKPAVVATDDSAPMTGERWAADGVSWILPEGWSIDPKPVSMRFVTVVKSSGDAPEVAVTRFPGDVGGLPLNINRWLGQVGLPSVSPAEAIAMVQVVPGAEVPGVSVADLHNEASDQRLVVYIVPGATETLFFKVFGGSASVGAVFDEVGTMAKSTRLE
jgi:hypothetical protein